MSAAPKLRVLIACHGHPKIAMGDAESAAWQLYEALQARAECSVWFLGCEDNETPPHVRLTQPFSDHEFIYAGNRFDSFRLANRDPQFPEQFRDLLRQIQPDIVHFHHYAGFGVEAFRMVREVLPAAKIILTLHEYLAICNNHGKMITNPHRHLCSAASPRECAKCFPDIDPSDFFLREHYIKHFFALVDHFIAPSAFLRQRYVAWGIAEDAITTLENVARPSLTPARPSHTRMDGTLRVGFFDQISLSKGINLLLDAARMLEDAPAIRIMLHGEYRQQPPAFQQEFLEKLEAAGPNVTYAGPYEENQGDRLMQAVDVVVVPSIWWENAPVVIEEALRNRRPVICSDIGGMAEKVRDEVDGFHFPVGNAQALASILRRIMAAPHMLQDVARTLRRPDAVEALVDGHLALYRGSPRQTQLPG